MFSIRSIMPLWCVSRTTSTIFISFLLLIKAISSCVISPSESVAIVGDSSLFSCNARPNNQQRGSIEFIKLGSDGASGTDIFRPPVYGSGGVLITKLVLAEGYFLSQLDALHHSNVTIQINDTQLKHGGRYFCSCVDSTPKLGTANFTVLDRLSFGRSGNEARTPEARTDLNCSVSFNGSTSSAFIDLTISDATGTQVSSKGNLSLIHNVTGHHAIQYKAVADPKEVQRFTCQANVWNKSSAGGSSLHSLTSNFSLQPVRMTTSSPSSTTSQVTAQTTSIGVAVGLFAVALVAVLTFY